MTYKNGGDKNMSVTELIDYLITNYGKIHKTKTRTRLRQDILDFFKCDVEPTLNQTQVSKYKERYIKMLNVINNEDAYYSITKAKELLGVTNATIHKYEKRELLTCYCVVSNITYYKKEEVDSLIAFNDSVISIDELRKELNIGRTKIMTYFKDNNIALEQDLAGHYCVRKELIPELKQSITKKIIPSSLNLTPYEKFEFGIKHKNKFNKKLFETENIYKSYVKDKLSKSSNKDAHIAYVAIYDYLASALSKNVFELTVDELELLIKNNNKKTYNKQLTPFLALHNKNANVGADFIYVYKPKTTFDKANETYTPEEWHGIKNMLTQTNNEELIIKVLDNKFLARTWLYMLLNLCTTWRKDDYINKLPSPNLLDSIGILPENFINWLKEGNAFTKTMAQSTVNDVKNKIESLQLKASKNSKRLKFIIPLNLVYHIGLLLAICESHRAIDNDNLIIGTSVVAEKPSHIRLFGSKYTEVLGNKSFSNLRCTASILTNIENKALELEIGEGYHYASVMRGHTVRKETGVAKSTEIYLKHSNKDMSINKASINLFRRGSFGFISKLLLEIVYGEDFKKLSFEDKTLEISKLNENIGALNIEGLSKFVSLYREESKKIIIELLSSDKEKINTILVKLSEGKYPSKMDYTQCLKKGLTNNGCIYPNKRTCVGCCYLIPQINFLTEFKNMIYDCLDRLSKTDDINDKIRYSYSIWNSYLPVLNEANDFFNKYEEGYINSFVDLSQLQNNLINLMKDEKLIDYNNLQKMIK